MLAAAAIGTGGGDETRQITERAIAALESAFNAYEMALSLDPRIPDTPTDYALLLADFGYETQALDLLDQALNLDPAFAPALFNRAMVLNQMGDQQGARAGLETLINQYPDSPYAAEAARELQILGEGQDF